jgi:hypothetical protein
MRLKSHRLPPAPSFHHSPLDHARARAPTPHSPSPTCLPHQPLPPETPPPLWFPSERHRVCRFTVRPSHPPPLSPIEAAHTFPLSHRHCRAAPPSPLATRALTPPMNAAVPRLLHCLHTAPPFGSAPPPTALPGALPVTLASSLAAPCRHPATSKSLVSTPPRCCVRELRAVTVPRARPVPAPWATSSAVPARQAEAQPACRLVTRGTPPHPVGCSPRSDHARHCARIKNSFSDLFNPINISKLLEFIENYRNAQKLQTKFCWTPLDQLYKVGLTKFIFVQ